MSMALQFNKDYTDRCFGFENIKLKWLGLLEGLLQKYPTVESRQAKTVPDFVYRI